MSDWQKPRLLIVDDDPLIRDTLAFALSDEFELLTVADRLSAIQSLQTSPKPPQLALVDLGLPPETHRPNQGFALISELLAADPAMKIVVLSGQNSGAYERRAMTMGAVDCIAKPAQPDLIREVLRKALRFHAAEVAEVAKFGNSGDRLIGQSLPMQKLRQQIISYADAPYPVLIEGESGSGKELVSVALHQQSTSRRDKPWLALNCAAIAPTLIEAALFGHCKGAFTGASGQRSGYFEDAQDGTLFLDEIGELPNELQAKLLRVLEKGEFQRLGETQIRRSRARIVAATNRNLRNEIRLGNFRIDLFHRLSVFTLEVPPLRDLGDDKLELLLHFKGFYARECNLPSITLDESAFAAWQRYRFSGNVRELRNIVIRLTTRYAGQTVTAAMLEEEFDWSAGGQPDTACTMDTCTQPGESLPAQAQRILEMAANSGRNFGLDQTLRNWERAYLDAAMAITRGNMTQAAKLLGIHRTTLYSRLEALNRNLASAKLTLQR